MTLSITTLCIECHYTEYHYAECHVSFIVILNVVAPLKGMFFQLFSLLNKQVCFAETMTHSIAIQNGTLRIMIHIIMMLNVNCHYGDSHGAIKLTF
jgi:hypothetical protein